MKLYTELAEYYYSIESNHRDINHDVAFVRSLIGNRHNPAVLDVGCGTGEHLNMLSRYGINCVGIDSSEEMLAIAAGRFPHRIRFEHADMREFDYYEEFDAVLCLFGSLNYMLDDADMEKALWNIWRAMKPDGIGVFEIWHSKPVSIIRKKEMSLISTTRYNGETIERRRGFTLLPQDEKSIVEVNYTYRISGGSDARMTDDRHMMRSFSSDEISALFQANGFRIRQLYANFLKEPLRENSGRIVLLADKE